MVEDHVSRKPEIIVFFFVLFWFREKCLNDTPFSFFKSGGDFFKKNLLLIHRPLLYIF